MVVTKSQGTPEPALNLTITRGDLIYTLVSWGSYVNIIMEFFFSLLLICLLIFKAADVIEKI